MNSALGFSKVSKVYGPPGAERAVLREVDFEVPKGRKTAVMGRSGSGKSTLLHLAAGIDVPSSGEIRIAGQELSGLTDRRRTLLRREKVGLVFQFFHLIPHLSVRDNVALPELIAGGKRADFETRIVNLLDRVGLGDRLRDPVRRLSGGEMQRIALCRALLRRPALLLADEPTGNLDDANGRMVMDLLFELVDEEGGALVFVTHSLEIAERADEVWEIHDGGLAPR